MRTVVTGGPGVLGRAAVQALVGAGHDVVVVTRTASASESVTRMGARPVRGNVLDADSLAAAYEGAEAVINLATSVPVGHSALVPGAWRRHDLLRTKGVTNVVEAARRAGVRRVVQESVSFMYADQGDDWITEHSPVEITSMTEPAAVGESRVQDYACGSRVGVVLRFGTIVGDDGQTRYWLRAARNGRGIGIGHPSDWAHVIHTDDLGGAVLASLHAPTGVYNVGAEPVQRLDLVQGYADAVGVESGAFIGSFGRWLIGPRLEPLSRWLGGCRGHFAAPPGGRAARPQLEADWLDVAREDLATPVHS
ncbi:MAG: NAD(P)-dependent oxidoreductase [Marmoricola sp.]